MTRPWLAVLALVAVIAAQAATAALAVWLALNAVHGDDRNWCATLDLLTSHRVPRPADPGANPSREQAYRFYVVFEQRRRTLGCG